MGWTAGVAELPIGAEVVVEDGYPLFQVHGVTSATTGAMGGVVDVDRRYGRVASHDEEKAMKLYSIVRVTT